MTCELIVKSEKDALKVVLPTAVVNKIKELSSLSETDFKEKSNEIILDMVLKSLDVLLYSMDHLQTGVCKKQVGHDSVVAQIEKPKN